MRAKMKSPKEIQEELWTVKVCGDRWGHRQSAESSYSATRSTTSASTTANHNHSTLSKTRKAHPHMMCRCVDIKSTEPVRLSYGNVTVMLLLFPLPPKVTQSVLRGDCSGDHFLMSCPPSGWSWHNSCRAAYVNKTEETMKAKNIFKALEEGIYCMVIYL